MQGALRGMEPETNNCAIVRGRRARAASPSFQHCALGRRRGSATSKPPPGRARDSCLIKPTFPTGGCHDFRKSGEGRKRGTPGVFPPSLESKQSCFAKYCHCNSLKAFVLKAKTWGTQEIARKSFQDHHWEPRGDRTFWKMIVFSVFL